MPADDIARLYDFTAGTTIQSSQVDAEFNQLISTVNTKFGRGIANTLTGNNTFSGDNTFSGTNTFSHASSPIKSDFILEYTSAAGVTIDSVRLKDGMVKVAGTAASNGEIGYASSQFQGYRNGSLLNFLMTGDLSYLSGVSTTVSSTYTIGTSDHGKLLNLSSSTTTLATNSAASLGAGFYCYVRNESTTTVTIDPNSSETIDGSTTILIYPGESYMIVCDGVNKFKTVGRTARFIPSDQTITAAGTLTIAHGYGFAPTRYMQFLVCQTGEGGYSAGDVVSVFAKDGSAASVGTGADVWMDSTNINVQFGSNANTFTINKRSATVGTQFATTNANWKWRIIVWP